MPDVIRIPVKLLGSLTYSTVVVVEDSPRLYAAEILGQHREPFAVGIGSISAHAKVVLRKSCNVRNTTHRVAADTALVL